ncbi:MAG: PAS domain S-box protein [Planctomycetota bacterium]
MAIEPSSDTLSSSRLLSRARDGVFVIDRDRRIVLFNEAMERLTGYTFEEVADKDCLCYDLLECKDEHGRVLSAALCPAKDLLEGTRDSARQRLQIRRKGGTYIHVEIVYSRVADSSDSADYVLGVARDVTDAFGRELDLRREIETLRGRSDQPAASPDPRQSAAPQQSTGELLLDPLLAHYEREAIMRAMRAANWQRNKAAQLMGISRSRLYRRMEALGIDPRNLA